MLAQESSWQVVLGPGGGREGEKETPQVHSQATIGATVEDLTMQDPCRRNAR